MNDLSELPLVEPTGKARRDRDGLHKRRGYWYYSLVVNGRRRFFSTRTKNYKEARVIYLKALKDHEEGRLPSDRGKLAFSKAADDWMLRRALDGKAENTLRTDRERLKPVKQYFGTVQLRNITLEQIYEYRRSRVGQAGPRTINLEVKVLRMILADAKCWSNIGADYKPLRENRRGPGIALNEDQLRHLIETASSKPEWDAAFLAAWIAANTTMRGGEIKKLRHRSVDLVAGIVRIERETTKTDGGCREIPLNPEAQEVFAMVIERAYKLGSSAPDHFLFPAYSFRRTKAITPAKGTGYDPTRSVKTWRTAWRSLRKTAGLPNFRFHDLRHTTITLMAIKNVPIPSIMAVAGHLSPEMTRHYTHVSDQAKAAAVAKLGVFRSEEKSVENTGPTGRLVLVKR
jgi:integrase